MREKVPLNMKFISDHTHNCLILCLCSIIYCIFVPLAASNIADSSILQKIISIILQTDASDIDPAETDINGDGAVDVTDLVAAISQDTAPAGDTLFLHFLADGVEITNQNESGITVSQGEHECDVVITSSSDIQMVISASGASTDGRISVTADTTFVLQLNGLSLTSSHAPAFNSRSAKRVIVEMADGTDNYLTDAKSYALDDTTETANGCLNTMGRLDLTGNGHLTVTGKRKHAIYSKKSIHFAGGTVTVDAAESDAVHSGKYVSMADTYLYLYGMMQDGIDADEYFEMESGHIDISLTANGAKGIKCIEGIAINGGSIVATATGNVVNKKGDLTYCTIIKADGDIRLNGAELNLTHYGEGGKGISSKKNVTMRDTRLTAELTGNGGSYINLIGEQDYYTPRAVEADDSLSFISGDVSIHCTGAGSKGVVCDHELIIGEIGGDNDRLHISIVTEGEAIVNNVEEDYREGCPKAFKSDDQLDILSGHIHVSTKGMGGEGFESKNEIWIVGGVITCYSYDDCFNGGTLIYVHGGDIHCCSQDNDGFDSNGSIVIEGGNIFSASLHPVNESFDTEGNTLVIKGGNIIGVGGGEVHVEQCQIPYFSYRFFDDQLVQQPNPAISFTEGNYLTVMQGTQSLLSAYIPADFPKAIVTIASPQLNTRKEYVVAETGMPLEADTYCDGQICISGTLTGEVEPKFRFTPKYIIN